MRVITVLEAYRKHIEERAALGIVPQPLNAEQTAGLVELLKNPPAGEEAFLVDLITNRVPPGVDEAAYVKAGFLSALAKGEASSPLIDKKRAVELLGTMQGGYNIATMVELLDSAEPADLIFVDLYNDLGPAAGHLAWTFLENCQKKLAPNGWLIINQWAGNDGKPLGAALLRGLYHRHYWECPVKEGNVILLVPADLEQALDLPEELLGEIQDAFLDGDGDLPPAAAIAPMFQGRVEEGVLYCVRAALQSEFEL